MDGRVDEQNAQRTGRQVPSLARQVYTWLDRQKDGYSQGIWMR